MFKSAIEEIEDKIISWRRDFHQHPELSFQESRTSKVIAAFMKECGLKVYKQKNGFGIIGDLVGAEKGRKIAFRADMDAVPIQEETDLPYASKHSGVMHACGHDGHMASLMGAIKILSSMKDKIKGTIRFIFQPAEEVTPGGAKGLIEEGVLRGVDAIYGVHLWSEYAIGTFYTTFGPMMAASDKFKIIIHGKGGHGAMPHKTIDPILIASHVVMATQHVISRYIDPIESGVISFGKLHSGTAFNVIADKAELEGTVRSFSPEVRDFLQQQLEHTALNIGQLYGAQIDVLYERGYPAVVNHEKEAQLALQVAENVFGKDAIGIMPPNMAGEDFAYYLEKVPGAFCFIGAGDTRKIVYPHHHPKFEIDERALKLATEWFCQMAYQYVF
ncbi:M20 metallopeptidase family protein [Bacillus alveayuensis]|uniref:M20 metallopeptidase family protein n=1 Tax=Aeribacillus alveayuensis TaxID=279215 RepID=UPI0005CC9510|nr:amidohydrolase [Bacillus alveayuensis]